MWGVAPFLKKLFFMKQNPKERLMRNLMEKPLHYPICLNWQTCKNRTRCLHALETTEAKCQAPTIYSVNPQLYDPEQGCTQFRDKDAKHSYAFGFTRMAERIKATGRYQQFSSLCQKHFSRTLFFDMRAGNRAISPAEQQIIIQCAAQAGISFPAKGFDKMVETTKW